VKWVANFGGIRRGASFGRLRNETIWSLLRSPHYSLGDVFKTIKGMTFAQQHLLGELAHWDLRGRVQPGEMPLHIFQGRWDKAANPGVAGAFSPNVIWFEESAHAPQYEESEKFRAELLRIHGTGRLPGNVSGE